MEFRIHLQTVPSSQTVMRILPSRLRLVWRIAVVHCKVKWNYSERINGIIVVHWSKLNFNHKISTPGGMLHISFPCDAVYITAIIR